MKKMKKKLLSMLLVVVFLIVLASPAYAGGDKNRGEEGQGPVHQVQEQDPPPFEF